MFEFVGLPLVQVVTWMGDVLVGFAFLVKHSYSLSRPTLKEDSRALYEQSHPLLSATL